MSITITDYLRARGFPVHPFGTTNAEREIEMLPSFFVRAPWFDWLVGNPADPESVILFAPQGYGKTSHRLEVARRAGERGPAQALVVTLNDFEPLLRTGNAQITLDDLIGLVRRCTLDALVQQLKGAPFRRAQLEQDALASASLHAMLQLFARRHVIGRPAPEGAEDFVAAFRDETIGPKTWLKDLAGLAAAAGFASVYCLLDSLDELTETRDRPEVMFQLISPLLDAPSVLEECNFAFKFFLPQSLQGEMLRQGIGRLDRIPHRVLSWSDEQLLKMLSQRLISYNRSSSTSPLTRVRTFQDLCAAGFDTDLYMVEASAGSPRRLIAIARRVLDAHCLAVHDPYAPISPETIRAATQQVLAEQLNGYRAAHAELELPEPPTRVAVEISLPEPQPVRPMPEDVPQLYLDDRGDIWLGRQRLGEKLPNLVQRCLEFLWRNRHQRVSYDDLQHHLYDNLDRRGDPQSSMEKLVRRLRQSLEPGSSSSQTYIETQPGLGYVLRNFRETQG